MAHRYPPAAKAIILVSVLSILLALLNEAVEAGPPAFQGEPTPVSLPTEEPAANGKIAPEVRQTLAALRANETITVIVALKSQADLSKIRDRNRRIRLKRIVRTLRNRANATQRQIRNLLQTRRGQGKVARVRYFWVLNGLAVTATGDVIQELAALPEVRLITPNRTIRAPAFQGSGGPPEPNLTVVNAPALGRCDVREARKGEGFRPPLGMP